MQYTVTLTPCTQTNLTSLMISARLFLLNSFGAMTHDSKSCMDRPQKVGAKWTDKNIAPDEKIETFELDYDGKRDRWNGYDAACYAYVIERYEARDEARKKYLKEQQLKKLEEKNGNQNGEDEVSDDEDNEDALKVDEAKVDESKQMDFAKVEKRVRTTGGGITGTVRTPLSLFSSRFTNGDRSRRLCNDLKRYSPKKRIEEAS